MRRALSRRSVLSLAGATGLALGVAACGKDDEDPPDDPPDVPEVDGPIDVTKLGAKADGSTDSTDAFRQAFAVATERVDAGAKDVPVLVPAGDDAYLVGQVTVPSGVVLTGTGDRPALRPTGKVGRWITLAARSTGAGITALDLDSAGQVRSAVVTIAPGATRSSIDDVRITSSAASGDAFAPTGIDVRADTADVSVTGCAIGGVGVGVAMTQACRGVTVTRCTIRQWLRRAVWVRGTAKGVAADVEISDCTVEPPAPGGPSRQPISVQTVDAAPVVGIKVLRNTVRGPGTDFKDPTTPGTSDQISLHRCQRFEVRGNTSVDGGEVGITVSQQSTDGVVADNTCTGNGAAGIAIGSGKSEYVSDIVVENNVCTSNGRPGRGDTTRNPGRSGFYLYNARDVVLRGNTAKNAAGRATQTYGAILLNCTGITQEGNSFGGNLLSAVQVGSATRSDLG